MFSKFNFTKAALEKILEPISSAPTFSYDTQVKGLAFVVSRTGRRSFVFCRRLGNTTRRKVLGHFPEMSIEQARKAALACSAAAAAGENPFDQPEGDIAGITFAELFDKYLRLHAMNHTKRWQDTKANYRRYLTPWSARSTSSIRRIEVQEFIDSLARKRGKHTANRCLDILKAVINWGIKKELIEHRNPCIGVDKYKVKPRERFVLPGDEFDRLREAINNEPEDSIRDFFWMCLYTGARKSNVLSMRWDDINLELNTWLIRDTKNGDAQYVTLTSQAIELLRCRMKNVSSPWVFPSPRKDAPLACPKSAWRRILNRAGIEDLRIHDLRRTVGSYMAIQGVSSTIIGKALGHRSLQATAIYTRLTQGPVREALENAVAALINRVPRD
jgi:integrase